MYTITIPKPCFESLGSMKPEGEGRYCNACAKVVIDFTLMSDDEVKNYFLLNNAAVCGRFKKIQLQRIIIELPANILKLRLPFWKRFLIILLLSYGGSFLNMDVSLGNNSNYIQGEPVAAVHSDKKLNFKKQAGKLKKKKRHKSFCKTIQFDFDPAVLHHTMGFTVIVPEKPAVTDILKESLPGNVSLNDTEPHTVQIAGDLQKNKKDTPAKPSPLSLRAEFILPALLKSRRRSLLKKK